MPGASRRVRRLRLRAPTEAAVRRAATLLEDALRTASLPDAGGRLLFVRRLALGRIGTGAPASALAMALERTLARAALEWHHGADPTAGEARAVWFRDPLDAHVALAMRVLAGPSPAEWYWPLAVPAWQPTAGLAEALREIAFSLAGREEASTALPHWFATLVRARHGAPLAEALRPADLVPLARAAHIPFPADERPWSADADVAGGGASPAAARADERATRRLVDAMAAAGGMPVPVVAPGVERARDARTGVLPRAAAMADLQGGVALPIATAARTGAAADGDSARAADARQPDTPGPDATAPDDLPLRPPTLRPLPASAATAAGGLLFLLHALHRIGYAGWLTEQPPWAAHDIARRVLARVLARLRLAEEDPAWSLVMARPSPAVPPRFVAPARWRAGLLSGTGPLLVSGSGATGRLHDAAGRLLLGAWEGPRPRSLVGDCRRAATAPRVPGPLEDEVVEAWLVASRRWVRRHAHMGLADLVLRPGRVTATPTHVDVELELGTADVRVRRAGLDLDPGWVVWFGRVVAFHYERARRP